MYYHKQWPQKQELFRTKYDKRWKKQLRKATMRLSLCPATLYTKKEADILTNTLNTTKSVSFSNVLVSHRVYEAFQRKCLQLLLKLVSAVFQLLWKIKFTL